MTQGRRDTPRDEDSQPHFPLWRQRFWLIVLSPVLLAVALYEALSEGWDEFWWELRSSVSDIRKIWRGHE